MIGHYAVERITHTYTASFHYPRKQDILSSSTSFLRVVCEVVYQVVALNLPAPRVGVLRWVGLS